ncbi:BadF/BadG/BcrA/BcrD ATPase family protein [Paracoccaceae bacterium Fryx2]|nr:BadF/BadG/BcrA/BcrD ATPase family protein [Paracoccaceae bacterium Fryx2]
MAVFLGIDGGGTGCRAAVANVSGRVLGVGSGGPANIASDPDGARDSILIAATEAADAAGVGLADLRAVLGLAGANVPGFAARLAAALPFASARVESDATIALKGALRDGDGIVAALGTGSVFAVQRAGVLRQIGGWGLVLGDEASGAWIGRALLARALRADDGFVPMTPLLQEVLAGMDGPKGVVSFALAARPAYFAALAPRVTGSDDPAAVAVMGMALDEVAAAIDLLQAGEALPVVFLGGLGGVFAARLDGRWPIRAPLGNGLDGALWMARSGGAGVPA